MTTAYTSLLGLALPVTGELSGTWGDTVNNSITSLLDTSVAGTTNVSTDTDVTLTTTTGAANTARQAILLFSGARTALRTVTAPAQSKIYTVINATTGGFAVKLVGSGPTTGLTIPNGASAVVAWNGSDFVEVGAGSIGNLVVNGTLTVTGATTLQSTLAVTGNITNTAGTANGVAYLNGSKVVTSGSALTFDGTNLGIGAATALKPLDISFAGTSGARRFLASYDDSVITIKGANASNDPEAIRITGDNIRFNTGTSGSGSEQMRLTSTGLGIGTSSPSNPLHIVSNTVSQLNVAALSGNTNAQINLEPTGTGIALIGPANNVAFAFRTNATERMRLDSSGNLGLGVTPSAWTTFKVMQLGNFGAIGGVDSTSMNMFANTFYDGAFKYINTSSASRYRMDDGHSWFTAPSGTAGNAITFTQAMTLDASGNLGVGTTSPTQTVSVGLTSGTKGFNIVYTPSSAELACFTANGSTGEVRIGGTGSTYFPTFYSNGSERMRLDSSGNLGLGVTPSAWYSAWKALQVGNASVYAAVGGGYFSIGSNFYTGSDVTPRYISSTYARQFTADSSGFTFNLAPSGTAGNAVAWTAAMTLDASGNLGVGVTSPATRLEVNGVSEGEYFRAGGGTISARSLQFSSFTVSGLAGVGHQINVPNASGVLTFATGSTERARIDSSGNLLLNTTSSRTGANSISIEPAGNNYIEFRRFGSGSVTQIQFNRNTDTTPTSAGSIATTGTTTTYNTSSDYRLKDVTGALTGYKERLMSLQPKQGTWKVDGSGFRGFLAHEFANPYRASVTGEKDAVDESGNPVYQGMQASSSEVMADLVALVKEQQAIIESLKARLDAANL